MLKKELLNVLSEKLGIKKIEKKKKLKNKKKNKRQCC